jgi:hypothetical protein
VSLYTSYKNFKVSTLLRTALAGAAVFSISAPTTAKAQIIGPITTSTPISHTTELIGAPSDVLTFPKFDGNLGILLSVAIHLDANISSVITVTNSAATPSSGNVFTQSQYTLTDPLTSLTLNPVVSTPNFSYSLAPGGSTTSSALTGSNSANGTFSSAGILAEFTTYTNQTIELPVSTLTQTFTANTGGNTASGQVTTAGATGTVTYNYTPTGSVPEPGALALISAGAVSGFVLIRRRRRK